MLGGLYGLEKNQKRAMILLQLAPSLITVFSLIFLKEAILSILLLQSVGYIIGPYLYIKHISKEKELGPYFLNEFRDKKKQIQMGTSLFISSVLVVFLAYMFMYEFRNKILFSLQIPMSNSTLVLILFLAILAFVNPILEEWFWRLFMTKTYQDSGINSWIINANYALFHFFILSTMTNWKLSIGLTTTFFSMGKSFEYIMKKYGFICTVITHLGVSIAATTCLIDVLYLEHKQQSITASSIAI